MKVQVLNTYWDASRDEVMELAETTGWNYDSTPTDTTVRYSGKLFNREVFLDYHFIHVYPESHSKLQKIEFIFFQPEDWLCPLVLKVLTEKYKEQTQGKFYPYPTWVIDDGQTAIQVVGHPQDDRWSARLCVIMSYNGEGATDRKIDYFQEAINRM